MNLKRLLWSLECFPLRFFCRKLSVTIPHGRLKGKRWIVRSGTHGHWLGTYEWRKRALFERMVTRESVVYDIGAHVGFYTLLASELVGPAGQVFAFEPLPRNLFYLREHLRLNGITNASVLGVAVSDSSGTTLFKQGATSTKGHVASEGSLWVETVRLDELVSAGIIRPPQYMKIDVEGGELRVLEGARSLLANAHPALFLATHGESVHQQCLGLLDSLGYKLQPVVGRSLQRTHEVIARR